jgi:YesN/AraC family two-component response regulator
LKLKEVLDKLDISYKSLDAGVLKTHDDLSKKELEKFGANLKNVGLMLLDEKSILVDNIKKLIIELVHSDDKALSGKFSILMSKKLGYDYRYISKAFSKFKGLTIQQYVALTKIERAKELMLSGDLELKEIADRMKYSNVSHLSNQFKKITGLSPEFFKK